MQRAAFSLQPFFLLPRLSRGILPPLALSRSYGTRRESKPWKQKPNRKAKLALILTEDVPNLGTRGHVVRVEHGYGRNWLLPKEKAVYATPDNMKLFDAKEKTAGEASEEDVAAFMSDVFTRHEVSIERGGVEEWSVYEHDVAKALRRFRLHVPLDCIEMDAPLMSYGDHPVIICVDEFTKVPFTLKVIPETLRDEESPPDNRFIYGDQLA